MSLTLFVSIAVVLIGISSDFDSKSTMQCNPDKTLESDLSTRKYIETQCLLKYAQEFHPLLPLHNLFMIFFGLVLLLSIIYAYLVKNRVEIFANPSRTTNICEEESQPLSGISQAALDPMAHQNPGGYFVLYDTLYIWFFAVVLIYKEFDYLVTRPPFESKDAIFVILFSVE